MKRQHKEILSILITLCVILLIYHLLFEITSLFKSETIAINVKATYYVVDPFMLIVPIAITVFFVVYLIRILIGRFTNFVADLIFILSNLLLIIVFTYLIMFVNSFAIFPSTVEYPPLSGGVDKTEGNLFADLYYYLLFTQIFLVALLSFVSIKMGLEYKITRWD